MSFDATLTLKNRLAADVTYVRLVDDAKSSTYTRSEGYRRLRGVARKAT